MSAAPAAACSTAVTSIKSTGKCTNKDCFLITRKQYYKVKT